MRKIIIGGLAAAAVIAPIAAMASPASAAQPTTTHNFTVAAASEAFIDLPALNSQFTQMVITIDGAANWGTDDFRYTSYETGSLTTGEVRTTGIWSNGGVEDGPLLDEGSQVGAVIYRVNGGEWQEITNATTTLGATTSTHVQVAYNDRPGSYYDNFGSLSLSVVRTKG